MKIIASFLLIVWAGFTVSHAQSGRVKASPTPAPPAQPGPAVVYSESGVYVRRRLFDPEDLGKSKKKKNKRGESKLLADPAVADGDGEIEDGADIITVDSTLVMIPVAVLDRNGLYIPDLAKEEFRIFEDGIEQEIAYFATSEHPFTVVLLLDTSPSTLYRIEQIREAAKAFVDELKPQDQVLVIEFDQRVHVLTNATSDRNKIYKAIDKADFGSGTSLYDAVEYTLEKKLRGIKGKKAIVLFTDGVDTTSRGADYYENINEVEESDVTIFPIYYNTFRETQQRLISNNPMQGYGNAKGMRVLDYQIGRQYLLELAGSTGGRLFMPDQTAQGLRSAFEGIAEELRLQYNLGYYPADAGVPGTRKKIKVRVKRPQLAIRNRESYVVGETKR